MDYKTIAVDDQGNRIIVTIIETRIYLGVTDIFREEVLELLKKNVTELIINLENVAVMNSAGLGVLIMARDKIQKNQGIVKLTNLLPLMQDIFSRMRLDTLFNIYDTIDDAVSN